MKQFFELSRLGTHGASVLLGLAIAMFIGQISLAQNASVKFNVNADLSERIQSISLLAKTLRSKDRTDADVLAAAQSDYQRILLALYENGYYSGVINIKINGREASQYSPFDKISPIKTAEILVNEGRVFAFGTAQITPLPNGATTLAEFQTGKVAASTVIGAASSQALDAWRENGRPKAQIADNSITADHKTNTLNVIVQLEVGGVAKFGRLTVTGNKRMRTNRVRKIAGLPEGQVYTLTELNKAADRLRATGIFSSVTFSEDEAIAPDGTLGINAEVTEAKLRRFTFGASLSTDEGAALEGSWLHRNLFGGGEQLRFDASVTGIAGETDGSDFEIGATITRPATLSPDTRAAISIGYGRFEEPAYTLEEFSLGLNFGHRFSDRLTGSAGIEYSDADTVDVFGRRNFNLIKLPLSVTYDTRDDELNPAEGLFLSLTGTPFFDLKDTHNGARLTFDGRAYRGFGAGKNVVLAGRVQLGTLVGPSVENVPADFLFYSGGGGTVRGQAYQSLGVELPSGDISGGKSFVGFNAELRTPIKGIFGGVLFADYGYIGADSALGSNGDSHAGVGLGLRIETGIGPLRIDVATPTGGGELDFYIGIGQAF